MIVFQQSGQLGNQLFQYAALRSLSRSPEKLVLLGFSDLQATFDRIEAKIININSPRFERLLYRQLYSYLDFCSRKNIVTRVNESNTCDEPSPVIYNKALFKNLKFVGEAYFQLESGFDKQAISHLKINDRILEFAKSFLNDKSPSDPPIFIHIRRGDYVKWPSREKPAVLPASYYHKCIDLIRSKISNPFFIFMSDDPCYVEDIFGDVKNSFISKFSLHEDFAIMTQCRGGILSASSFSWWAAYFSNSQHPHSHFLGPKYWAGHRSLSWYPPSIESSFIKYIDV